MPVLLRVRENTRIGDRVGNLFVESLEIRDCFDDLVSYSFGLEHNRRVFDDIQAGRLSSHDAEDPIRGYVELPKVRRVTYAHLGPAQRSLFP